MMSFVTRWLCVFFVAIVVLLGLTVRSARAQETPSFTRSVITDTIKDPTTFAPAVFAYGTTRLDWTSSQIFFQQGYVESNPVFTRSGRPNDVPLSYGEGNRKITMKAVGILEASAANNLAMHTVERSLAMKYPNHRRLLATMSWAERISFASYVAYMQGSASYRQWQQNTRQASAMGLR